VNLLMSLESNDGLVAAKSAGVRASVKYKGECEDGVMPHLLPRVVISIVIGFGLTWMLPLSAYAADQASPPQSVTSFPSSLLADPVGDSLLLEPPARDTPAYSGEMPDLFVRTPVLQGFRLDVGQLNTAPLAQTDCAENAQGAQCAAWRDTGASIAYQAEQGMMTWPYLAYGWGEKARAMQQGLSLSADMGILVDRLGTSQLGMAACELDAICFLQQELTSSEFNQQVYGYHLTPLLHFGIGYRF